MFRGPVAAAAALLASAVGVYFGTGVHPIGWVTWLTPIPVLLIAAHNSRLAVFVVAFLSWAIGGLNSWHAMRYAIGIPAIVCVESLVFPALGFALITLLFRRLVRRGALWQAAMAFPWAWVSAEYLTSVISPHGTYGNLAYSQTDCLPILQIASITGIWGISDCLLSFCATAAVLIAGSGSKGQKRALAIGMSAYLALVFGLGYGRLGSTSTKGGSVTVGLVASDLPQNIFAETPAAEMALLRQYAEQAESLAARGAQVVVIPEKTGVLPDANLHDVDAMFEAAATRANVQIVVGMVRPTLSNGKWNEARMYSPPGVVEAIYEKHHMLPLYESSFTTGTTRTVLHEPSGVWGIQICKDMDFQKLSRQYGRDGVGLLLVPAWDFTEDGWLHGRMAILRGVEDGYSIARSPKQGILTVTDDRGRVIAEQVTNSARFATLVASVPVRHDATLYARLGDWFAWVCVAGFVFSLFTAFRRGTTPGLGPPPPGLAVPQERRHNGNGTSRYS
jgi:apolipoprotein N-acyltransferase